MDSLITLRIASNVLYGGIASLWNGFTASLIILRGFGKKLSDSSKHCVENFSENIENVWNKSSGNMHSLK